MRTSILSRSVIAVATLAVGSAAFAAVPANAATYNGITRAEVLAATNEARAIFTSDADPATPAVKALAAKGCGVSPDDITYAYASPAYEPDGVDGLAVNAQLKGVPTESDPTGSLARNCTFGALATVGAQSTLNGEAIVGTETYNDRYSSSADTFDLSGNVFASPAIVSTDSYAATVLLASGIVDGKPSATVLTKTKKADKKSSADKKAAKKAYAKRLKAIKKSYKKALKKAGSSQSKKAVAKATYKARRSSAKQAYRYAVAPYKFVNVRSKKADGVRFSIQAYSYYGLG